MEKLKYFGFKSVKESKVKRAGYSILEMLVAIGVFAIIGVVATNSLASSFRNSKKATAISGVKSDVDYAMSTMERLLRNARSINLTTDPTPSTPTRIYYKDEFGNMNMYFDCDVAGNYIASGSATLGYSHPITSSSTLIDCSGTVFAYPTSAPGVPQVVELTIKGTDKNSGTGVEGSSVTSTSRVLLRNYSD